MTLSGRYIDMKGIENKNILKYPACNNFFVKSPLYVDE